MKTLTLIISILTCVFLYSCNKNNCKKLRKEYSNSDAFSYFNFVDKSNWTLKDINGSDTIYIVFWVMIKIKADKECSFYSHNFRLGIGGAIDNRVNGIVFENYQTSDKIPRINFEQSIYDSIAETHNDYKGESFFDVNITTPLNNFISLSFIKNYNYMNINLDNVAVFTFNIGEQPEPYVYKLYYSKSGPVKLQLSDSTVYEVIESDFTKVDIDYYN